jgi:malonate-semialdehyde dehydrogenase (acetylating)/methylmalonate-semialdehyde dehydrogenase
VLFRSHMVVLPDADVEMAADAAVSAAYGSAGERCMAISVVVAVGDVADPLVEAIEERLPRIKVGPGTEEGVEMGPLITREHRDKVASYLDSGVAEGATLRADGRQHVLYDIENGGFFLGVSLLDNVTPEMECYRNEIFGPVLEIVRVPDYPSALALVNDNPYGNGTAIFTRDGGAARQYQFDVNVGMVGINVPIPVPVAYYSFGGWKASLFGDLHMYGPEGIQFYTRGKVVTARWPDPGTSSVDLGFPRMR